MQNALWKYFIFKKKYIVILPENAPLPIRELDTWHAQQCEKAVKGVPSDGRKASDADHDRCAVETAGGRLCNQKPEIDFL